jgi:hypothetical protein
VDAPATARTRAADGWRALRAFVTEGVRHLPAAVAAFEEAERLLRRSGAPPGGANRAVDPGGGGSEDVSPRPVQIEAEGVLIGLSLALRLRRRPEDVRRAVVLAQELLNIVRRRSGEAAAVPLRAYLEDAYRDLADVTEGDAAVRAAEEGIEACDRTLALARRFHADDAVAHARATKALLLRRLAAAVRPVPADQRPATMKSKPDGV